MSFLTFDFTAPKLYSRFFIKIKKHQIAIKKSKNIIQKTTIRYKYQSIVEKNFLQKM